jgi:hypothetical protein
MNTLKRLRAIANRAGSPTMDYAPDVVICEQRDSLDWIAHEAAEAIKELAEGMNALELGAAARRVGLAETRPMLCPKHSLPMRLVFIDRPGSPPGNALVCTECVAERQKECK